MNDETTGRDAAQHPDARNVRVGEAPDGGYRVTVCAGTACVFAGSLAVYDAFTQEVETAGLGGSPRPWRKSSASPTARPPRT